MSKKGRYTLKEAARIILEEKGKAMSAKQISSIALRRKMVETSGKTPELTMGAHIYMDIKRNGKQSPFIQKAPGLFMLNRSESVATKKDNSATLREGLEKQGALEVLYVAKNDAIPEYIKIGKCRGKDRLVNRIKELYDTNVPLPFSLLCAVEVPDAGALEKVIKQAFAKERANNKREFYDNDIFQDKIFHILNHIGEGIDITKYNNEIRGSLNTPEGKRVLKDATKVSKANERFNLGMVGIKKGSVLKFSKDESITCTVLDNLNVLFAGKKMSLSKAALKALRDSGYNWSSASGPINWEYEGEKLKKIREELESKE